MRDRVGADIRTLSYDDGMSSFRRLRDPTPCWLPCRPSRRALSTPRTCLRSAAGYNAQHEALQNREGVQVTSAVTTEIERQAITGSSDHASARRRRQLLHQRSARRHSRRYGDAGYERDGAGDEAAACLDISADERWAQSLANEVTGLPWFTARRTKRIEFRNFRKQNPP